MTEGTEIPVEIDMPEIQEIPEESDYQTEVELPSAKWKGKKPVIISINLTGTVQGTNFKLGFNSDST